MMTIRVKVYAPAFIRRGGVDEEGWVALPDKASLSTLYKALQVPLIYRTSLFYSVNTDRASMKTKLKDGDVVSFLFPFSGG